MTLTLGTILLVAAAVIFGILAVRDDSWLAGAFCLFAAGHVLDGVVVARKRTP